MKNGTFARSHTRSSTMRVVAAQIRALYDALRILIIFANYIFKYFIFFKKRISKNFLPRNGFDGCFYFAFISVALQFFPGFKNRSLKTIYKF
jgi:hypothetical protein